MSADAPLVVLGFDSGHLPWLLRWAQEGHLPTLRALLDRGCWGRLAGPELVSEHGVALTLWSGVSRERHGHYFLQQLVPGTYDLRTVGDTYPAVPPFWHLLQGRGARVAIFDAPTTCPIAGLRGFQLANWAAHNPSQPPQALPPALLGFAARRLGPHRRMTDVRHTSAREDIRIYGRLRRQIERKGAFVRDLVARGRFDLVVAVFGESHTGGHQFWQYRADGGRSSETAAGAVLRHAIRDLYAAIDRELGRLLAMLPAGANVVVLSQFGLCDHYPTTGLPDAFCRRLGYQASPADDGAAARTPLSLARRALPAAWRERMSRPLPRALQDRLLSDKFRAATDWGRTAAFAIPSYFVSYLQVNLRGREPCGTVAPGAEYDALLDRLEADLRALVDPRTGAPAVADVLRTTTLFGGGPPSRLPDLFVHWRPAAHFMDRVLHPRAVLTQRPGELGFYRDSSHSHEGFFAAAGPAVAARGPLGDVDARDVAPTCLALLDAPLPPELPGRPLAALLSGRMAARANG